MEPTELLAVLDKKPSPEQINIDIESLYNSFKSETGRGSDSFDAEVDLAALDKCLEYMQSEIESRDAEIRAIVRKAVKHSAENCSGSQQLGAGKEAIEKLFVNLDLVHQNCSQPDDHSLSILNEIKSLHHAKTNIVQCLTALEDFEVLVNSLESLKLLSTSKNYADILPLFDKCRALGRKYEAYRNLERVQGLFQSLQAIESQLERSLLAEFKDSFSMHGLVTSKFKSLEKICQIVDLMDHDVIGKFQSLYSQIQLKEFLTELRSPDHIAATLQFSERKAWFDARLRSIEEDHLSIFPKSWHVLHFLSKEFISVLCEDLLKALESEHHFELGQIVRLKQDVNSFENFISAKLGLQSSIISDCVEPFMKPIVDEQEKSLGMVMESIKRRPIELDPGRENILQSSLQLVNAYRSIFQTMTALSRKQSLADTASLFARYFTLYREFLMEQCVALVDSKHEALSLSATLRLFCLVLNTISYCIATLRDLEERFKSDVDLLYQESVHFSDSMDEYKELSGQVIEQLKHVFELSMVKLFESFHKLDWGTMSASSLAEHSDPIKALVLMLNDSLPMAQSLMTDPAHYQSLHYKLVDLLSSLYVSAIYKCKRISEPGAEKMLMDLDLLQNVLLSAGNRPTTSLPLPQLAKKMFSKPQQILQAVLYQSRPPQNYVEKYLSIFHHESLPSSHLEKLLELKGIRKSEQEKYMNLLSRQKNGPDQQHSAS